MSQSTTTLATMTSVKTKIDELNASIDYALDPAHLAADGATLEIAQVQALKDAIAAPAAAITVDTLARTEEAGQTQPA